MMMMMLVPVNMMIVTRTNAATTTSTGNGNGNSNSNNNNNNSDDDDQQQQQHHQRRRRRTCPLKTSAGLLVLANEQPSAEQEAQIISESSDDTVIARPLDSEAGAAPKAHETTVRVNVNEFNQCREREDEMGDEQPAPSNNKRGRTLRSLFIQFAGQHLGLFHGKKQAAAATTTTTNCDVKYNPNLFIAFAQKYFNLNMSSASGPTHNCEPNGERTCYSCPVTPVKQMPAEQSSELESASNGSDEWTTGGVGRRANGYEPSEKSTAASEPARPSVRFLESTPAPNSNSGSTTASGRLLMRHKQQVKFAECGVQTSASQQEHGQAAPWTPTPTPTRTPAPSNSRLESGLLSGAFIEDDSQRAELVEKLFKLCEPPGERHASEPMNSSQFRESGYKLIDYICNYLDTIRERRVTPINIEPGYLKALIQPAAPEQGEPFSKIMHDFEEHIMCGITHWQHPHFHAYFPAGNAYPSILADMLSDALGCVGFSWAASPAYTELEIIMLDWMGKMVGLPDEFLCLSGDGGSGDGATNSGGSRGGGVIQGSASECVLVSLLAARHWAMEKLRKKYPETADGMLLSKLIGYCSKEAHSCVEKAAMIGFIRMRALDTDEQHSLRGDTLARAMEADLAAGLEPFIVCATLGTTSCVSFDNLRELGEVCRAHDNLWLHVDAAYAGSALICPEFKYLMDGIELATSFNMNPNKWLLINFDCSLMWVKDRFKLTRAFVVDPLYLQHSFSDQAIDYRHWGIPLSRRFRALKLWFVIRNYGLEGLRDYIRKHVRLAKLFAHLIEQDARFTITNEVVLGLVCFRLVGSNALNQRLLSMINASGKLHMVPASLNGRYIIRFCVCDQNAQEADIHYAYECIAHTASELFELIRAGKERIRAISQQNTIDVSSISLHTQQSASADRLNGASANESADQPDEQQVASAAAVQLQLHLQQQQQQQQQQIRHKLRRSSRHDEGVPTSPRQLDESDRSASPSARSPLVKQMSLQQHQLRPLSASVTVGRRDEDSLGHEVPIDSLASINGRDFDLELDDDDADDDDDELDVRNLSGDLLDYEDDDYADEEDDEQRQAQEDDRRRQNESQSGALREPDSANRTGAERLKWASSLANDSISPIQRGRLSRSSAKSGRPYSRTTTTGAVSGGGANEEEDEAADELVKLIDKRNRMSLRYKREFFVRVVSDPRVYRASISGDINAHASSNSLSSASQSGEARAKSQVGAAPVKIAPTQRECQR